MILYSFLCFLQSRTVIVENLPDDYTRQSLEKMFNVVGRSII